MFRLIALAALLCLPMKVLAEEIPQPSMMFIKGGILCDSEDDLKAFLTATSLNGGKFVEGMKTTCGRFVPREPIPMMVTPTEWYEMPDVTTLIAHFLFFGNGWEQWGYVAVVPNPDYIPTSLDPEA